MLKPLNFEPRTLNLNYAKRFTFNFLLSTFNCRSESTPPGLHLVWGIIPPGRYPGYWMVTPPVSGIAK